MCAYTKQTNHHAQRFHDPSPGVTNALVSDLRDLLTGQGSTIAEPCRSARFAIYGLGARRGKTTKWQDKSL